MKHLNIQVIGLVQGVFYRAASKAVADQLGVKGFAMNQPDGSVYMEVEGDSFALDSFLEFCAEGSDRAKVEKLVTTEGTLQGFKNYEILKKRK
ncbi:acylphosphatase [Sphingobacterium sp. MYb382]|uniref:acylphosphatase n=1 Tax=Sphingobacterium sp. MYb382 TaxID=2745278 RepID=UPI0030B01AFC